MIVGTLVQLPILIHHVEPRRPPSTSAVRIPAPALSAMVTCLVSTASNSTVRAGPVPALGFPLLVPPLSAVTGAATFEIRFDWITLSADICSPIPIRPSHVAVFHVLPHVVPPLGAPEHCFAAPCADALSLGMMVFAVKGAICVVAAIQRERNALKDGWSLLQLPCGSHATSCMMFPPSWAGKKS